MTLSHFDSVDPFPACFGGQKFTEIKLGELASIVLYRAVVSPRQRSKARKRVIYIDATTVSL